MISQPADVLGVIVQMLIAGKVRFVFMQGELLRYRRALVRSYSIRTAFDEDDLLGE